jgi:hypothetical protein
MSLGQTGKNLGQLTPQMLGITCLTLETASRHFEPGGECVVKLRDAIDVLRGLADLWISDSAKQMRANELASQERNRRARGVMPARRRSAEVS